MAKLTDDQDTVLSILDDHGPSRFTSGRDLGACQVLFDKSYIEDRGTDGTKAITAKGVRYLARN